MGQINNMNNMNPLVNQLRMNPMLMQQYYMVMQNPNLNPQMYAYFNQMMQMNNVQNNNNFINLQMPSQMGMNQQMTSQMGMNQQMPSQMNMNQHIHSNLNMNQQAPSFQQHNSFAPSVNSQQQSNTVTSLNKNSLQINTSYNFTNNNSGINDQSNVKIDLS
jgi:hypothetical protein